MILVGCGAGRTMVKKPPAEFRTRLAPIQTECRIGSAAFGGSVNSAIDEASAEIVGYAAANFR